ncbi:MAG: type I glyceraldehyde-3-phosphate dehydrogenase [Candidatus Krumholzibacteriia bacterium]|nr:type I glyceraldehyde-3-phosphate dehydrogenase [Candidatus Latescibacterota bacterium]MCB9516216.1 type I glyceraldehyde-3-phosphate dehydrogenase [Candidatus Latescibacterota bacterium]
MRIAINGFGRIGRSVFRILNGMQGVEVVAINDITDNDALAYLLKHDTVMGPFPGTIAVEGDTLRTRHQVVKMTEIPNPAELPWGELGVDFVIESTGRFRKRSEIEQHLSAGARKVVLTVPAKDEIDCTVVLGVNEGDLKPEHKIVSNASCTTNCLAPMAKVLHENFEIVSGVMTTVHAYTNDQRLADVPHSDWRRSRAAAENIIPTTTGAAKAVGKVLPALAGKLDGMAMRVPIPDGSIVDLVAVLKEKVTAQEINAAMRAAAKSEGLKRILKYSEDPIVSSDIVGDPHSSIFDAPFTRVVDGHFAKTMSWYDNEWGYSNRVVDLLGLLSTMN